MIKVINIVNHAPAYENYEGMPRPEINWDDNESWVGIWGFEWHDIQGGLVLDVSDDIVYEVWQPDYRASKMHKHTFENDLTHRLFPATNKKCIHGLHSRQEIFSIQLINTIDVLIGNGETIVLHINGLMGYLNKQILNLFSERVPIVAQFYNNTKDLFTVPKTKNIFRLINAWKKNFELSAYYKKLRYLMPSVEENTHFFEKKYGMKVFYRNFYNFPIEFTTETKKIPFKVARVELNIKPNTFMILSLSRLVPVKQIDKFIQALAKIKRDFVFYIVGSGTQDYTTYLKDLAISEGIKNKVKFVGFISKNKVHEYYSASNLFVSCSKLEGGPTTPFEAAFFDVPVLLSNTGIAYEFFKKHNAGKIIPADNYNTWPNELEKIIDGETIKEPDKSAIIDFGNRNKVSCYYRDIYHSINNEWKQE